MVTQPEKGFLVTGKTLTVLVSVITIVGALFAGVTKVNSWDNRLSNLEINYSAQDENVVNLSKNVQSLERVIIDLKLVLTHKQLLSPPAQ
jgi:uncharacterized coiled-coil protein SlyX